MLALLLAGVISSFFLIVPLNAGAAEQEVRLDVAELRGGAVPRVRIAASPHMRSAAFYARTADGLVQPIYFTGRLTVDGSGPVLQVPAGEEHLIPIGGTPGLFVAARTGLKQDREAVFVLLTEGLPAVLAEATPISAGVFFRQLAAVTRRQKGALHILPYMIAAAGLPAGISRKGETVTFEVAFDGIAPEAVFTIADILTVEGDGPLAPVVINLPEEGGGIGFRYSSLASETEFRERLGKIAKGAGLSGARVVDDGAGTHLTVIASEP
ncbi:hypothetical protein [Nisaea denitrificans]|uniref:hypothetical protein n=1 Tax=Nisaea denitrificans TaxID=390877 RepID=UPI0004255A33|nr:hypothetical protein [Nisaea denitrificans]